MCDQNQSDLVTRTSPKSTLLRSASVDIYVRSTVEKVNFTVENANPNRTHPFLFFSEMEHLLYVDESV